MKQNTIRQRWNDGVTALGTFVFSRDAATTDIAAHALYDFVIADLEHAPLDLRDVEGHIRAADANGICALARISSGDLKVINRILDMGAAGIVYPHFGVDLEDSRAFADVLRYAPAGRRPSCGSVRANRYSLIPHGTYTKQSDADVISIGLIEDIEAVDNLEAILRECKVDVIMPGAGDLSTSMGLAGQQNHPEVRKVVERIVDIAQAAGVRVGMYLRDPEEARAWKDRNISLFVYQVDLKTLAAAYKKAAEGIRSAIAS